MAYDDLLRASGPTAGNPIEASAVTADADLGGGYRFLGKYLPWQAAIRLTGAFDRADGDESIVIDFYEASDAAGTSAAVIASSASATATHAANLGASTANGKTAGSLSDGPLYCGFSTSSKGWIKAVANVSGTSPSVAGIAVNYEPANFGTVRRSGT